MSPPPPTALQSLLVCFSGWLSVDRQCFPSPLSPVSQTEASASVWRGGAIERKQASAASFGNRGCAAREICPDDASGGHRRNGPHGRRDPGFRKSRDHAQAFGHSSSSRRSIRFAGSLDGRRGTGVLRGTTGPSDICGGIQWGAFGPPWPGGGAPGNHSEGSPGSFSFSGFFVAQKETGPPEASSGQISQAAHPRLPQEPRMLACVRLLLLFNSKHPLRFEVRGIRLA